MATTKIWAVKERLRQLIEYVCDLDKTTENETSEALKNLIWYDADESKTEQRLYVTGIGCTPENALSVMNKNLSTYPTNSDRVAYHAYQSFAEDEVDPKTAHAIGVAFAQEMWGENFPVLVTTHLNTRHVHNHYAICATGFDGRRFHADGENYRRMREVSDRLCQEHGLSVIKNPQRGKTRHIGEIKAEQEGRPTVRGIIRRDMDIAIKHSTSFRMFENLFQALGYTLEWRGQYLRIRPDASKKFFRMDKLGEGYTLEDVKERILDNARNRRVIPYMAYVPREKPKGLYALYIHYCYLLGALPKERPNNREAYAVIKEDVKRARMYNEEAKLLGKYNINTAEELSSFTEGLSNKFKELAYKRAKLRNKLRRMHDTETMQPIKDEISELSSQMADLRKQMKLCEDIAARSGVVEAVVNMIHIPDKDLQRRDTNDAKTKNNEREDKR